MKFGKIGRAVYLCTKDAGTPEKSFSVNLVENKDEESQPSNDDVPCVTHGQKKRKLGHQEEEMTHSRNKKVIQETQKRLIQEKRKTKS